MTSVNPLLAYLNGAGSNSNGGSDRSDSQSLPASPAANNILPPPPPPPPLHPHPPPPLNPPLEHHTDSSQASFFPLPPHLPSPHSLNPTPAADQTALNLASGKRTTRPPSTQPDLSRELPVIHHDLIKLSALVERVAATAHAELSNLAEILPDMDDQAKKRAIVDYVLQTRRQLLKLLVLVRWSSEASNVAKCMNIIGFLTDQNYEFNKTIDALTEAKAQLGQARVRNYDIPTALSVLTKGTYERLPARLQEEFGTAHRMEDREVGETLKAMNEVLRWRLSCVESVPLQMGKYWIADGRVTFRVEGMWEASFMFAGEEDDNEARWYLLNLKFLFRVKDSRGVWASVMAGSMKDKIVQLCDIELGARSPNPSDGSLPARDSPLSRAYDFLQRLALSYQLEALLAQAYQLRDTLWSGHLNVELSKDRDELKLEYWIPPPPPRLPRASSNAPPPPPPPPGTPGGTITISRTRSTPLQGSSGINQSPSRLVPSSRLNSDSQIETTTEVRAQALAKALARGTGMSEGDIAGLGGGAPMRPEALDQLHVVWTAEGLADKQKEVVNLTFLGDLSLEALLRAVTTVHARDAIRQLHETLLGEVDPADLKIVDCSHDSQITTVSNSSPFADEPAGSVTDGVLVPAILIHLYGQHDLLASISHLSGKLEFKGVGEAGGMREETRLRSAADKVDKERKVVGDIVLRVRDSTIVDEVDSRAVFLGYRTTRRMNIRQADWTKFGPAVRSFLFVELGQIPLHYLTFVLMAEGFRFALLSVREVTENMSTYSVLDEVGWLVKLPGESNWSTSTAVTDKSNPAPAFGYDVSIEDLRDLYEYCSQRIAYFKIEQQLHIRNIPSKAVASRRVNLASASTDDLPSDPPAPSSSPQLLSKSSPYLALKSSDLLKNPVEVAYPNVAIQCSVTGGTIRATFHVRFRDLALAKPDPSEVPSSMTWDPKTSIVVFTSEDIDNCVSTFLIAYSVVARSIVVAQYRNGKSASATVPRIEQPPMIFG